VPEELCRFVPAEWPGVWPGDRLADRPGESEPFIAWCKARSAFIREHGHNTALGDPLDVIAQHRDMKIRWATGDE
jgi:hypothetical protein